MSDPSRFEGSPPSRPRWVKVSAVVALVLILLVGALLLFGGGDHGPGRHTSSGDGGGVSESQNTEGVHTPPEGGHR